MSYKIAYTTAPTELPSADKARAMVSFMEEFYATSDDPNAHDKYVASFTPDATMIMGPKVGKGSEGMYFFSYFYFLPLCLFEVHSYISPFIFHCTVHLPYIPVSSKR